MKTLTLLRHAKSGWDDPVARDFDRPLNPKGRRAATTMGRHLRSIGQETLEDVGQGYGALSPEWDKRLYLASAASLLDIIHECPASIASLLLVGHNPGLEDLVLLLAPDEPGTLRDCVEEKYPTATLAELTFAVDDWAQVVAGGATLTRFIRPRDVDATLGPESA